MSKVFLSGPIINMPQLNEPAFRRAEEELTIQGHHVMSPIKLWPANPHGFSAEDYLHICFAEIDICEVVYFLDGWENSKGAMQEWKYATNLDKTLWFSGFLEMKLQKWDCTRCVHGDKNRAGYPCALCGDGSLYVEVKG